MLESRNKLIIIYCMAEQKASFYVMVLTAMIDHDLHEKEVKKINEIANKYKIKFDPYEASLDIKNDFKNDFDKAFDFYVSIIESDEIKMDTIEFIKDIAYADGVLHDKEIQILEKCRNKWGIN